MDDVPLSVDDGGESVDVLGKGTLGERLGQGNFFFLI